MRAWNATTGETFTVITSEAIREMQQLVSHYEAVVFQIALHLISDEEAAHEVVEEVFSQINEQGIDFHSSQAETIIHRLTYDAALSKLFCRVEDCSEEVQRCGERLLQSSHYLQ